MKVTKINTPFPAVSIDAFIPSKALVRAAAQSFELVGEEDWVKYAVDKGQVQYCSRGRDATPPAALSVMDYIATHFDPNVVFDGLTDNAFPDMSHYGGGMMITPNSNNEGGFLGMHIDADIHAKNPNWKREYSAILCLSEEYDSSFDLLIHDGKNKHSRIPYKFNRLNVFKCSKDSWHGLPEISKGMDRKTLGVMYWSVMGDDEKDSARSKAEFNKDLDFS
jgi:hypothetical protein